MNRREQLNEAIEKELSELVPFIHGEVSTPEIKEENHRTHLDDIGYPSIRGEYLDRSVCILFSTDSPTYEARLGKDAFLHPVMQIILFNDLSLQFSIVPHRPGFINNILHNCGIKSNQADIDPTTQGTGFDLKYTEDKNRLLGLLASSGFDSDLSSLSPFAALRAGENYLKIEIHIEQSADFHNLQLQRAIESLDRLSNKLTSVVEDLKQEEMYCETSL